MNAIADRLKYIREKLNLTQGELALKLNISQQAYSRYERGLRRPSHKVLVALSEIFGLDVNQFYRLEVKDMKSEIGRAHV